MERGLGRRPDPLDDLVIGLDAWAGLHLGIPKIVHGARRHDASHPTDAAESRFANTQPADPAPTTITSNLRSPTILPL